MSLGEISLLVWRRLTIRERRQLWIIWVLILIGTGLETLGLGIILPLISVLASDKPPQLILNIGNSLGGTSREFLVLIGSIGVFVVYSVKNAFSYVSAHVQRRFLNGTTARLAQETFESYVRSPYEFHLRHNSAQLINDVEISKVIVSGGLEPLLVLLTDGLVAAGFFMVLVIVEPVGSTITILVFCLAAVIFQRSTRSRIARWGKLRKHHLGQVLQHQQQGLGGIKEVKVFGKEERFLERHEINLKASMEVSRRFVMLQTQPRLWLEVIGVGSLTVLIGVMTTTGRPISEVLPIVGLFAAAAFRVIPSVGRILASIQSMTFSAPQIRNLLLQPTNDFLVAASSGQSVDFFHEIEVSNLVYRYGQSDVNALDGVSLTLLKGEAIGIVGASGAGKSTFIDLFLGLLRPQSGTIKVDGIDISSAVGNWQGLIGYVPQSIYLLDDSIRKNIAFGCKDDEIDDESIFRVVKAAQLDDLVASLPDGVETIIGERGVRLSGGQRQRIGIARALFHDPPIIVLDEATSALDAETERDFMEAVRDFLGHKTIVIVAHRLTTVGYCTRVYRLERGRVVWVGPPSELQSVDNLSKAQAENCGDSLNSPDLGQ